MNELNGSFILKQVSPNRLDLPHVRRKKSASHQRPVDIIAPGVYAGNKRSQQYLNKNHPHQRGGMESKSWVGRTAGLHQILLGSRQLQHEPDDCPNDRKGKTKVNRQHVRGHIKHDAGKSGGNHPPANDPLKPAEDANQQKTMRPTFGNTLCKPEEQKACGPDQANDPAKLPMTPFPPIDEFKLGKQHSLVLQLIFRRFPVLCELSLPGSRIHRRHCPRYRLPFRDRKPAVRQSRDAADGNNEDNEDKERHQPQPNSALGAVARRLIDDASRAFGRLCAFLGADLFEDEFVLGHIRSSNCQPYLRGIAI